MQPRHLFRCRRCRMNVFTDHSKKEEEKSMPSKVFTHLIFSGTYNFSQDGEERIKFPQFAYAMVKNGAKFIALHDQQSIELTTQPDITKEFEEGISREWVGRLIISPSGLLKILTNFVERFNNASDI